MAKYNKIQTLVLMIALLFSFTMANSSCEKVYVVRSGDTCTGITQMFKLSPVTFDSINPNLNCNALSPGQWICVSPYLL
ncbi:hypothetical protein Q3G72_018531 [Acer saccharum]|nr:hypothetical protein Q3G72_018531 [Acer saccharum]